MAHVLVGAIQEQQEPPAETGVLSFWPLSLPHKLIEVGTHHSTETARARHLPAYTAITHAHEHIKGTAQCLGGFYSCFST